MARKDDLLNNFYGSGHIGTTEHPDDTEEIKVKSERSPNGVHKSVTTTFMIRRDLTDYIEVRAKTGFSSKSVYINWLIEQDMKDHPEILDIASSLSKIRKSDK